MLDGRGANPASAARSSGSMGSIIGWCEATSMFTRRANVFCCRAAAISASTCSGGPAITVWRGDAYTVTVTSGWPAISASVESVSNSINATAPVPAIRRHQPRPGRDHPQPFGRRQRAGHHRGGHLAHRMSDQRIGLHSVGPPQSGQRQLHPHQHRLDTHVDPTTGSPPRALRAARIPISATNTGSRSATAAANAGSSASSRRPIPGHCEP